MYKGVLIFLMVWSALSQDKDGAKDVINSFRGGNIGIEGTFKLHSLSPPGALNLTTSSGFVTKTSELVFYNAGAMANIDRPVLSVDVTPPGLDMLNIANSNIDGGFNQQIEESLDKELEQYKPDQAVYNYPKVGYETKSTLAINSMSFVMPINDFRLGLGFFQSVDFGINFLSSGVGLKLDHLDPKNPINELSFVLQNEMAFDFSMNISEQFLSAGYRLSERLNIGATYINTSISGKLSTDVRLEGFIRKQGEILAFNTKDTETFTNSMYQTIDGHITNQHGAFRFSANFEATPWFGLSVVHQGDQEMDLDAGLTIDINYPNFFSGEDTVGDGSFSIDNNLIDAVNATRTRKILHKASDFKLYRSGKTSFVGTVKSGSFRLVLQYDTYSGADGVTFKSIDEKYYTLSDFTKKYDTIERLVQPNQKFLLEPQMGGKFGLKWGFFHLGAGFTLVDLVQTKEGKEERSSIAYGNVALGFKFKLSEQFITHLTVASTSLPVGRISFVYSL